LDDDVLDLLARRGVRLRPGVGDQAVPGTPERWAEPVQVAVIGVTESWQLRLETDDERVVELRDRAVYAEFSSSEALFRIHGTLEVLTDRPLSTVCRLMPVAGPEVIQRREWLRVPTSLPVTLRYRDGGKVMDTISIDLSGGGIQIRDGPGLGVGSTATLTIALPSGPVQVECEVVTFGADGAVKLRFLETPEVVSQRIVRHVFDVQLELRKGIGAT
jgi:hypothetical protein